MYRHAVYALSSARLNSGTKEYYIHKFHLADGHAERIKLDFPAEQLAYCSRSDKVVLRDSMRIYFRDDSPTRTSKYTKYDHQRIHDLTVRDGIAVACSSTMISVHRYEPETRTWRFFHGLSRSGYLVGAAYLGANNLLVVAERGVKKLEWRVFGKIREPDHGLLKVDHDIKSVRVLGDGNIQIRASGNRDYLVDVLGTMQISVSDLEREDQTAALL